MTLECKRTLDELSNIEEQWIYFLQNPRALDFIPKNLSTSIQQALSVANKPI
ncbi:MAG: hypothetical protein HON94_01900 [Methylococcales bacterium]|jgi:hypothetical protein|nr:hypothetical protein [Methylococcales bacterium]MBT7411137.1 hypothetical protein [Methylococcales bacterium]